jgi:hypothetical protein
MVYPSSDYYTYLSKVVLRLLQRCMSLSPIFVYCRLKRIVTDLITLQTLCKQPENIFLLFRCIFNISENAANVTVVALKDIHFWRWLYSVILRRVVLQKQTDVSELTMEAVSTSDDTTSQNLRRQPSSYSPPWEPEISLRSIFMMSHLERTGKQKAEFKFYVMCVLYWADRNKFTTAPQIPLSNAKFSQNHFNSFRNKTCGRKDRLPYYEFLSCTSWKQRIQIKTGSEERSVGAENVICENDYFHSKPLSFQFTRYTVSIYWEQFSF